MKLTQIVHTEFSCHRPAMPSRPEAASPLVAALRAEINLVRSQVAQQQFLHALGKKHARRGDGSGLNHRLTDNHRNQLRTMWGDVIQLGAEARTVGHKIDANLKYGNLTLRERLSLYQMKYGLASVRSVKAEQKALADSLSNALRYCSVANIQARLAGKPGQ